MMRLKDGGASLDATPGNTAISTYTGIPFDLFDSSTWVFDLDDIATALGNTCRYGGHVKFYSVAEHCVRVASHIASEGGDYHAQMVGLLHDATETYVGDIPRPIKKSMHIGDETFEEFEATLNYSLMAAFGLSNDRFDHVWHNVVKPADYAVYLVERAERPNVGGALPPSQASDLFMFAYHDLANLLDLPK